MTEPVQTPAYWKDRLKTALLADQLHQSVFLCGADKWNAIRLKHQQILKEYVSPNDKVLDAGCGYGRLVGMLGDHPKENYRGIDISPDLVAIAKVTYPGYLFSICSILHLNNFMFTREYFDWAVLISIRPMIKRNLGDKVWQQMEQQLRLVSKRILFLEYDETNEGSVE